MDSSIKLLVISDEDGDDEKGSVAPVLYVGDDMLDVLTEITPLSGLPATSVEEALFYINEVNGIYIKPYITIFDISKHSKPPVCVVGEHHKKKLEVRVC